MKLQTDELRSAFALLDHVPQVDMIESSRFLRCSATEKNMELHMASGLMCFCSVKVKEGTKLKFHLDRAALGGFLKAAQGEEITLQTGNKLVLQQGRSKLEVATPQSVSGYGVPLEGKFSTLEVSEEEFVPLQTLQKYVPRKSIDERYSALQGIKGFGWLATDGLVLAAQRSKLDKDITLPAALLEAATGTSQFLLYEKTVSYKNDVGTLHQPIHADLAAFPREKIKGIAESAFAAKPVLEMEAEAWLSALQYFQHFSSEDARLECEVGKNQVLLKLSSQGMKAERSVPAKVTSQVAPLRWNLEKLIPWAASFAFKTIRLAVMDNISAFTTETKKDLLAIVTLSS